MKGISLHNAVALDAKTLTPEQEKLAMKAIQRIANGNTKLEDIEAMHIEGNYYRWKPTAATRKFDCEIRVVYEDQGDNIHVIAVLCREHVYGKAVSRIRATVQAALQLHKNDKKVSK